MRVLLIGGTGPVGLSALPHLLEAGHTVAVAHTGAHEPAGATEVEHIHGSREQLLRERGAVERWRPDALVDSFPGGATAGGEAHEPLELPLDPMPIREDAARRPPRRADAAHDNVAMEDALTGPQAVTVLRPGAIYGPFLHPRVLREWYLVGRVARGERKLPLPDGGTQLFHRVAAERVGRAVAAALERAPAGRWECNVGDPRDFTFGALAALVAERLSWDWEPVRVAWDEGDHPWNARLPIITDTTRLRETLGVTEPDPVAATEAQIDWLWENRERAGALPG